MEQNFTFYGTLGSQSVSGIITKPFGVNNVSGVILVQVYTIVNFVTFDSQPVQRQKADLYINGVFKQSMQTDDGGQIYIGSAQGLAVNSKVKMVVENSPFYRNNNIEFTFIDPTITNTLTLEYKEDAKFAVGIQMRDQVFQTTIANTEFTLIIDGQEVCTNKTNANGDALLVTDKLFKNVKDKKCQIITKDSRFKKYEKEVAIERPMTVILDFIEAKLILQGKFLNVQTAVQNLSVSVSYDNQVISTGVSDEQGKYTVIILENMIQQSQQSFTFASGNRSA